MARSLVAAVRRNDIDAVLQMVDDGIDVNDTTWVEPACPRPQELPLYETFPLFEACRCRNFDMIQLLLRLPTIDVNAQATRLKLTPFADACSRGDTVVAGLLLSDPRVDGRRGSTVVSHAVLYACMTGTLPLLKVCAQHGLLDDEVEASAVATAAANGASCAQGYSRQAACACWDCIRLAPLWSFWLCRTAGGVEVHLRALREHTASRRFVSR
jgi:ankyrin repeat protein